MGDSNPCIGSYVIFFFFVPSLVSASDLHLPVKLLRISMYDRTGTHKSCYLLKSNVPRQTGKSYELHAKKEREISKFETSSQQSFVNSIFQDPDVKHYQAQN